MLQQKTCSGLTGNQLKLFALVCMTCDHLYHTLLPQYAILNVIGRLAFPIFAYMIAEGCRYTRNRTRYLMLMAISALLCQAVYFFAMGSLYQCILVTFSLSIGLIYLLDHACRKPSFLSIATAVLGCLAVWFLAEALPQLLSKTDYRIDYGIMGIFLPVLVFMGQTKLQKLLLATIGLCLLSALHTSVQWFSLLAIVPLALYNGNRGKWKLKYLFYIYYPLHLAVLHLLQLLLTR